MYRKIYQILEELMEIGVDGELIHRQVYDNYSESRLRLLGAALNNMVVMQNNATTYMYLTKKDLHDNEFKNGFLNKQGTFTSLSSALIFQSVAVAKTTIKKMNLGYVIFADVNIQIKQISEEQLYPVNDIGYLGTIIAQNEQEEIKQNFQIEKKQKQKRL